PRIRSVSFAHAIFSIIENPWGLMDFTFRHRRQGRISAGFQRPAAQQARTIDNPSQIRTSSERFWTNY
ncbi:MAG TPA: hypothetical protein VGX78_04850, partial [Pirellulales bacterium]|nr:hypothetical protein [Pirellulales bacterium]